MEAVRAGARKEKACELLGITVRTLQQWQKYGTSDRRRGAAKSVPRKLSCEERQEVLDLCATERFRDLTPHEIVPTLAQEGRYVASEATFYRVLRAANQVHHRSEMKPKKESPKPSEQIATGPNQVWCWDITWLPLRVRGMFVFAYVIIDVYDRSIIGWAIHDREDAQLARELFEHLQTRMNLRGVHLHSDNGGPMKGLSLLALLYVLGVSTSYSRPRVSNDNPFIESFFKTLKYTAGYPGRFRDLQHARTWMADFIAWYNSAHRHSALGYVTPHQRRTGVDRELFQQRNQTLTQARALYPERWGRRPHRRWEAVQAVTLNSVRERQSA
jgi:putative transposase